MRGDKFVLLLERQHAARVGERMDHHGGVLAGFDDFVEIANRPVADRQRQRPVVPDGSFRREQETAGKVGGSHVLVGGDGDERPASRHAMYSTKRVLPEPVGPFSMTGSRLA